MSNSESAVTARINRKLAKDGEQLKRCRETSRAYQELGRYYIVNANNYITSAHIELPALAAELGVM